MLQQETVGGRPAHNPAKKWGGGYLDGCNKFIPQSEDPRFNDLKAIGLDATWLEIADQIGFEKFLKIWEILDKRALLNATRRVWIPSKSIYEKLTRNRLIFELASAGATASEIQSELKARGIQVICKAQIWRINKSRPQ